VICVNFQVSPGIGPRQQRQGSMSARTEPRTDDLIDRIVAFARTRLGAKAGPAETFLRAYYANVSADDLAGSSVEDLYGAAIALWQFGRTRRPGQAKVRVYTPRLAEHGWSSTHSVVEIVNDDMPFLVDSVTAELNRRELTVHLVIHPIVRVVRDGKGAFKDFAGDKAKEALAESYMHVEIDQQGSGELLVEIERSIEAVLADVRVSVADWKPMLGAAQSVVVELGERPPPVPPAEVKTAREFLTWLMADHFTFLGYREYEFVGEGDAARTNVVAGSGLGLCREDSFIIFEGLRDLGALPPDVRDFVRQPRLLMITKANRRSTVHRPVHLDVIGIKRFDRKGKVTGQYVFVGLFTSTAYSQTPREIPLLSEKVARIIARAGFPPNSHDAKALQHILDTFSRNELFQATEDQLFEMSLGVLRLQDRQRIALFVRRDSFERFMSCFVYVPRDRYTTELRLRFQKILEASFAGSTVAFASHFGEETALVRVHIVIRTTPGEIPAYSIPEIVARLTEAARTFSDRLRDALIQSEGEERGLSAWRRYADAFPVEYRERFGPEAAVADIAKIETVLGEEAPLALNLYRVVDAPDEELRFRVFHKAAPLPLSDVLPMLEAFGLRVISESAYEIAPAGSGAKVWMHDFAMSLPQGQSADLGRIKPLFEDAFAGIWAGTVESDGFNRLVIAAQLDAREVSVLRAYAKYLRQAAIPFSQPYMESALGRYPQIARRLVDLFKVLHDPARRADAEVKSRGLLVELDHLFDGVFSLDDDRILRRFLNLIRVTLRTNYFQSVDGRPKPWISFKLDSQKIEDLPLPRPMVEVFVYSPRVEAIHLRGGKVARGGIRWSDRREDFRTEILGLMKAQMVKNAVIVPVGSKGGFFVKRPPPPEAGREAALAEGQECYRTLVRGLLDITDNLTVDGVKPPPDVVRHDGDDPYLVVAADKGTATFSDIANAISREYGFWLDDAFASGGSSGYDHKGMGITARGAWVAVQRHFRELGIDVQTREFTVVGVGDMSGDVFGNGMLRSRRTKLVVAFDHRHIFVDPSPDPEKSYVERERLFRLPRSSWADYDRTLISKGGGVFERALKSIRLTPEMKALLAVEADSLTPAELIAAALKAPVDLLWLGGIGTYVKASDETNAEVGDRANDALRVNGADLRARVVGEGANLGVTQRGRIEYAQKGGRINTDAIDNSAGVDTSDHEVNIKILLGDVVARGDMTIKQRDKLLAKMTDEVARQVLRDNYLQTQALSVMESEGAAALDAQVRLIRALEKAGRLNRAIEFLPDDEEIQRRQAAGQGLTRPELAVLLAYAKLAIYDELLPSDLPDEPAVVDDLLRYFPTPIREQYHDSVMRHRLRREIVATVVTNSIVNRTGATFVHDMMERSGATPAMIARAYFVARAVFGLRATWEAIEHLDNKVPAAAQYGMLRATQRLLERAVLWFLRQGATGLDVAAEIDRYGAGLTALEETLDAALEPARRAELAAAAQALVGDGVPDALAQRIVRLGDLASGLDIVRIATRAKAPVAGIARLYFGIGARLGLDWLRGAAARVKAETPWQKLAVAATIEDLLALQAELTARAMRAAGKLENVEKLAEEWLRQHKAGLARFDAVLAELRAAPVPEIAGLTVASRELRALTGA
jgi:glutamate dehydrogenase